MSDHPHVITGTKSSDSMIASILNTAEALLLDRLVELLEINLTKAIQQSNEQTESRPDIQLTPELFSEATQTALSNVLYNQFKFTQKSARKMSTAIQSPQPHAIKQSTDQTVDQAKRKPIRCYLDGCFDMMHSGHYNAIRQAKQLTDQITERDPVTGEMVKLPGVLVVGVHSDAEIAKHKGGPPVMNDHERLEMVKNCKWVDEVVFDTPYNPSLALLDSLNCDFCVHGDDFTVTADGKDAYWEVKEAGRMKIFKRTEGVSTTDLVGRLLYMTREHHLSSQSANVTPSSSKPATLSPVAAVGSPLSMSRNIAPPSPAVQHQQREQQDPFASRGISTFLPTTYRITQFSNNRQPGPEDRIVYIDGAFDLFHIGHVETLKKAAELGTFLYVGVHDDATINQHKGLNYPIMNLHERVLNVLSCFCVDEVVIGAPWRINEDLIKSLGIHVVVTGTNTKFPTNANPSLPKSDPYEVAKRLGIYQEIDTSYLLETDEVVQRIVDNRLKFEAKNAARSIKEKDYLTKNKQFVREI